MVAWSESDQRWHWSAVDRDGRRHAGAELTQGRAESEARMAEQMRAGEPDRHGFASWRTKRWSRREQRWVPNVPPRFPRLPSPPAES